jgi:nucleolar MIF4G domain-containing protein 1
MIETMVNLKNNKIKHSSAQQAGSESVNRLRKFLSGLAKKHHGMFYLSRRRWPLTAFL